ncbi:MAG TPA: hypothetical protein VGS80_09995 [Ktedonobacterales bacterium]|nr:hypothetical protein [Ktedonobacterales bacterium]
MTEPTGSVAPAEPTEAAQPAPDHSDVVQPGVPTIVSPQPYYPPYLPYPPPPGAFVPYLPPPQRPANSRLPSVLLVAAGALVAIVIVFGVLDLTHTLFPAPDNSTRPVIIQFQGGAGTAAANAVLQVSPATLTLACNGSAAITLTNTGGIPLSWQLATLPDDVLLSSSSPHSGTLASGQRVALTVVSLGRAGAGQLHFSDDRKEDVTAQVVITCP